MLYDVSRRYPRAYVHRHKLQKRPEGFGQEGPAEIHYLIEEAKKLVEGMGSADDMSVEVPFPNGVGSAKYKRKKIYDQLPHVVADNHFSGDHVLTKIGEDGGGATMTNRRDRFPKGLKKYFHHEKVKPGCPRAKAMRYENPIVAIKQVPATATTKGYTKTLVSFQSTGATNIAGVNNLPSCQLYVTTKKRGRGTEVRVWGIEQNEGRQTYLVHYYGIDNTDHMIKLAAISYISWKYWHASYLHGKAMGVIAAYDMYRECCDGLLDASWAIPEKERMTFTGFRQILSEQMLTYDPRKAEYKGDEKFRKYLQQNKKRRAAKISTTPVYSPDGLTIENMKKALNEPRICLTKEDLKMHFDAVKKQSNATPCEVCGKKTLWECTICKKRVCVMDNRSWNAAKCVFKFHDEHFFGLARCDSEPIHDKRKSTWKAPSSDIISRNARQVRTYLTLIMEEQETLDESYLCLYLVVDDLLLYCVCIYLWLPIRATIAKPLPDCKDGRRLEGNVMRVVRWSL